MSVQLRDAGHGLCSQVTHVIKVEVACPCLFPLVLMGSIVFMDSSLSVLFPVSHAAF